MGIYKLGPDIDLTLKGDALSLINKIDFELDDLMLSYTFDFSAILKIRVKLVLP